MTDLEMKIEDITRQIEAAIKFGRIDSELRSRKKARQAAIKAIVEAERVDPRKLCRPMIHPDHRADPAAATEE